MYKYIVYIKTKTIRTYTQDIIQELSCRLLFNYT